MKDFSAIERKLNIEFKNKDLLTQAFCHRSFLNENPDFKLGHNERLEFLGDAVLELIVTDYLFRHFPEKKEGELTNLRAALVNAHMLFNLSKKLGFDNFLLLSKGEEKDTGKGREYILANTFESFVGALYLDRGYKKCEEFLKQYLFPEIEEIVKKGQIKDAKSRLQEEAQERLKITPTYKVLDEWGPDHEKHFLVGVFLGDEMVVKSEGSSKREAEESAAKEALKIKRW